MAVKTELAQDVLEALQPHSDALDRLARFTAREWQAAYFWLDSHGITLTLADRLRANPAAKIPAPVRARFEANLRDNADRCRDMLEHFAAVNRRLESAGVVFAVEKGFALCPEYWTEPALRLQLDLDYLIEPGAAPVVARLLAEFGYQRTPRAEREWGFETAPGAVLPHDALYQPSASRFLEFHFPFSEDFPPVHLKLPQDALRRRRRHAVCGVSFPVLDERDMFLEIAAHIFRHFSTYTVRLSHLLELAHFVRGRQSDARFWSELRQAAACDARMGKAIGLVVSLAGTMFPFPVPDALATWSVELLSPRLREWIALYGREWCLRELPGSKISVLALREFLDEDQWRRHVREVLLPIKRPPRVFYQSNGVRRRGVRTAQLRFVARRLAFHSRELMRFAVAYLRLRGRSLPLQAS